MKNILILLFLLSSYSFSFSQIAQDWLKTYKGIGNDVFYSVTQTKDKNFLVAGKFYSDENSSDDYIILKINPDGDEIWKITSTDSLYDQARVAIEDNQGNYLIAGSRSDFALLLKLKSIGDTIWTKEIDMYPYCLDQIRDVQQMTDSTYIMVGVANGDPMNGTDKIWVMNIDDDGNIIWSNTYSDGAGNSVAITDQNNIFVVSGAKVLKLKPSGEKIWEKAYNADNFFSIKATSDNSLVLTGSVSDCCYKDLCVIKIDNKGDIIWNKRYGGEWEEIGKDIMELEDGGYLILGKAPTNEYGGPSKIWVLKTDSNGDTLWTKKMSVSEYEFSSAYPESFTLDNLGNPIIVGMTTTPDIATIPFILKLSIIETGLENKKTVYPKNYTLYQNVPNPFNPKTSIEYQIPIASFISIVIYNQLGQQIATLANKRQPAGKYKVIWNAEEYPSGIYYYRLEINNEFVQTKKMVFLK